MKPKTQTIITSLVLLVCFVLGCSTTHDIDIRSETQLRYDEPFEQEIRAMAVKRERFYYLGKAIDQDEYDRRVDDIVMQQDRALLTSQFEAEQKVVPIIMLRF